MTRFQWCGAVGPLLLMTLLLHAPMGQATAANYESSQSSEDEATLRELGESYVAAFNQHDAKALAEYWSPDAVYTNRLTGERLNGRDAIAAQFANFFEDNAQAKLNVVVESIEFLSPNVAIEKGVATFISEGPEEVPYSAVYVKRDGKWLLDRLTDDPQPLISSHSEQLKPLEWMVGSWADQDDAGTVRSVCHWTKNKNFLSRSFTVSMQGQVELSGIQIIGWDAGKQRIRSWTFDSDGGFAEGAWSNEGNQWYVIKKGTTANGQAVSAVNVMTRLDDDSFALKSVQRAVDGQIVPDLDEVIVVRQ